MIWGERKQFYVIILQLNSENHNFTPHKLILKLPDNINHLLPGYRSHNFHLWLQSLSQSYAKQLHQTRWLKHVERRSLQCLLHNSSHYNCWHYHCIEPATAFRKDHGTIIVNVMKKQTRVATLQQRRCVRITVTVSCSFNCWVSVTCHVSDRLIVEL